MNVFACVLEGQVYQKASSCCIFYQTTSLHYIALLTKPKKKAKSMEKVYMQVFTVCFAITAALRSSFALTVVESVEPVHDALLFPASEVQASVSLILCHFLLFHVNIEVYQTQNSSVSFNFLEIHHHQSKMLAFVL